MTPDPAALAQLHSLSAHLRGRASSLRAEHKIATSAHPSKERLLRDATFFEECATAIDQHAATVRALEEATAKYEAEFDRADLGWNTANEALRQRDQAEADRDAHAEALKAKDEENAILRQALGEDSEPLRQEVSRRRESFRTVLLRAEAAESQVAALASELAVLREESERRRVALLQALDKLGQAKKAMNAVRDAVNAVPPPA